jgi:hypothetical protein
MHSPRAPHQRGAVGAPPKAGWPRPHWQVPVGGSGLPFSHLIFLPSCVAVSGASSLSTQREVCGTFLWDISTPHRPSPPRPSDRKKVIQPADVYGPTSTRIKGLFAGSVFRRELDAKPVGKKWTFSSTSTSAMNGSSCCNRFEASHRKMNE